MKKFQEETEFLERVIKRAGRMLLNWSKPLEQEWKGDIDPVTLADKEAEQYIINEISSFYPEDIIVSEETNALEEEKVQSTRRWYVDPLDGTVNFSKGYPNWCISIALVNEWDQIVCSAVFDPVNNELFTAIKDSGAWLNGKLLMVSNVSELNRALGASGFPYNFDDEKRNNLREWVKITPRVLSIRSLGSAAKDICQVAAGRLDFFWEQGLERWDVTAAALICKEAGAKVTNLRNHELNSPSSEIVVANPNLHKKIIEVLDSAIEE